MISTLSYRNRTQKKRLWFNFFLYRHRTCWR